MNEKVDFFEDIKYATLDYIRRRNYQTIIKNFPVKKFDSPEQENSKDDYDFSCELNDGTKLKIEFKNRRIGNIYGDIALEVYHDYTRKFGGCIFNLIKNEVDYYIYTWHEKPKRGYIIFKAKELESWWRDNHQSYEQKINKQTYEEGKFRNQSSWCAVPIKDIPEEIIYKYEIFPDLNDFFDGQ